VSPRRSAEEIAEELRQLAARSAGDRDQLGLVHEVQVYQEELTVQNEELTRAQHALEETRDRFVELYDFAPNGYLTLDPHGLILRINLTGAAFLGKPRATIEGMPLRGFVAPGSRPELLAFLRRCRAYRRRHAHEQSRGPGVLSELVLKCADGTKDVQLVCRPRHGQSEGERVEFFAALIDLTDRKRLEAERTQTALECAALSRRLLSVQDDERHRIARDLHDNIGQHVTSLRLMLDVISMAALDVSTRGRVTQSLAIIDQLDRRLDFITGNLRPASLDLGVAAAIEQFVGDWSSTLGIEATFGCEGMDGVRLAPDVETHLYRVVQEALNNVAKHAAATCVSVSIKRAESTLVLTVDDDGRGFGAQARSDQKSGLGLVGMRERARIIGGSIDIDTTPGEGTTIRLHVPLEPDSSSHRTGLP
jgi:PAS domain S-box-containing protein